jgi:UDP-3-O-[3-hydroxymyristoyl] glucosamine N-acyltransferase
MDATNVTGPNAKISAAGVSGSAARACAILGERGLMATIKQLAELVGAAKPDAAGKVSRVSSIDSAQSDSVVIATDRSTYDAALGSSAGAILVSRSALGSTDAPAHTDRVLVVPDARFAFALAAQFLHSGPSSAESQAADVHPTAVLGKGVQLGRGTVVGPHAVLGDGVIVGSSCRLLANSTIYAGTRLGERVVVQAGAVLGSTGFGYARNTATGSYLLFPQQGTLVIENDVEIGANTTIDRGALGETRIGAGTKIDNLVHIAHNCTVGRNVIIAAQTGISGSSIIEDGAILGGQVGLGEHAHVGPGVILGGGAGVLSNKKVRGPGQVFWGRPARPLKQYLRDLARLSRG